MFRLAALVAVVATLALAPAHAGRGRPTKPASPYPVSAGYRVLSVPAGEAALDVAVWYPTGASESEMRYGATRAIGRVALDAPLLPGTHGIVVLSHGYGAGGIAYTPETEHLARWGWIVAAPDHSDAISAIRIRTAPTGTLEDALREIGAHPPSLERHGYRPAEVRAVLDALLGDKAWRVDPQRIALVGHSMGGWTVVQAAFQDARPKALVSWSMGELQWRYQGVRVFDAVQLAALARPVLWLYGGAEAAAIEPRRPYAVWGFESGPTPAALRVVPDGGHAVYSPALFPAIEGGTPEQIAVVSDTTRAFLARYVGGDDVPVPADATR